jgi:hypothetical protein
VTALVLLAALLLGVVLGNAGVAAMRLARGERLRAAHGAHRRARTAHAPAGDPVPQYAAFYDGEITVTTPLGPIVRGFKYCPTELRVVAMTLHPDGSASCDTPRCHTHIHATTTGD